MYKQLKLLFSRHRLVEPVKSILRGDFMDIWGKDIEEKAVAAGLEELLAVARSLYLDMCPMDNVKVLQKSETRLWQLKKPYRQSKISGEIRSRILQLSFDTLPPLSCQRIANIIHEEFNQSISKSTVSRIINHKYKPKFNK
jgi:hypothetical protein